MQPATATQAAFLQGWIREVNRKRHTAQLHDRSGDFVRLRFPPELDEKMSRLATRFVELTGQGQFDETGAWKTVLVNQVTSTRSHHEPFDLDAFLNDPKPKIFDPDNVVTASVPFDVDDFLRTIYAGRDVEQEDPSD